LKSEWRLPTISEILAQAQQLEQAAANPSWQAIPEVKSLDQPAKHHRQSLAQHKAEREWIGAIAALEHLLDARFSAGLSTPSV
jgi:hypothetical protein